jgi:hypothetical protein
MLNLLPPPSPTPSEMQVPLILLAVLQLVALVSSFAWYHYSRTGRVALPTDDDEDDSGARANGEAPEDGYVTTGGSVS